MDLPLFDGRMLRPLVDYLDRHGVKPERYLDRERIPREVVSVGGWITKRQAYDLVLAVVEGEHCFEAIFAAYADFQLDDLGYSGTNNFARAFRRMTAMAPTEYRRREVERL